MRDLPEDQEVDGSQRLGADDAEVRFVCTKFTAKWCGPCQRCIPVYSDMQARLQEEYRGQIIYGEVDNDDDEELVTRHGVTALPTFIISDRKSHAEVGRVQGSSIPDVERLLRSLCAGVNEQATGPRSERLGPSNVALPGDVGQVGD